MECWPHFHPYWKGKQVNLFAKNFITSCQFIWLTSNLQKTLHHEVMHHIQFTKLKTKSKINKNKDLKQDLQVLWMLSLRFHTLTLFFAILHNFWLHFPMKSNECLNISINPIFPIFFSFIFCFDYLLGCHFCCCSFLFYGTMFNIWITLSSSFSSIECRPFLFTNFLFPLPPPFVQLYLQESCQGHKMVNSTKMVKVHPFQCPQFFDFTLLHLEVPLWKKGAFCNWPCNSIFELQWPLAIHYISTLWRCKHDQVDKKRNLKMTIF
jgi:hypothetical protein